MRFFLVFPLIIMLMAACDWPSKPASDKASIQFQEGALLLRAASGEQLRLTPYGEQMLRVQRIGAGEKFLPDDHYAMVAQHTWPRAWQLREEKNHWRLQHPQNASLRAQVDKNSLAVSFYQQGAAVLQERQWQLAGDKIQLHFVHDAAEHFTGLGHGFYGRESSLDLRGKRVARNYGSAPIEQAPLLVPFYLSSKGYGVFVNSSFRNEFNFGEGDDYSLALWDAQYGAQLDYFFIAGPQLRQVLDNYTQLTGRPRLPPKAVLGLQLSDKGHDHTSATPSDERWWREKIGAHRAAGFPLDHVINDNRWRAGGGKRCESRLEWDRSRYPDPKAYGAWLRQQGLILTLDLNRCIAQYSAGWQADFNVPPIGNIEFNTSAPDLTNPAFRRWFWQVFYQQSLDPALGFPGDALWIDEFDEMGAADGSTRLHNGRTWAEMRNYWFMLIAQALVQDGWDKSPLADKRPFVWVRGMTAGAQRYASLWSGDIYPNYGDMQGQVRAMQLAGLAGFAFWGHDAGGFFDWNAGQGPDEPLYQQWALALGAFAPIWKPHGMGQSRWPLDRSVATQRWAQHYSQLRYTLMPYLYTAAHQAAATGLPIARPMLLDYPQLPQAWQFDLQYFWGDQLLVAPAADNSGSKTLWLPPGRWYPWQGQAWLEGERELIRPVAVGELPLYVKAGAIIPRYGYALATALQNKAEWQLDIYTGADGSTQVIEDDDTSEAYRRGQRQLTRIHYQQTPARLTIAAAEGSYPGAPESRRYRLRFYGAAPSCWLHQGQKLMAQAGAEGGLELSIEAQLVAREFALQACTN